MNNSRLADKPCTPADASLVQQFLSQKPSDNIAQVQTPDLAEQFRHGGWAPFRKRVDAALAATPGISPRRLSAFRGCGCDAYVEYRLIGRDNPAKEFRIRSTKCHDRFCVPCAAERSSRIRDSLARHMYQRENMSLITLTLAASTAPLTEILDRITRCFRLLRNKPLWKKAVQGGCSIIETKLGEGSGAWHVHFHILAETKFLHQARLSELWHSITGDSRIVDIRRVGAHSGAISYITKYVCKAADHSIVMSPKHLQEAITAFNGRRLVSTFGTWRGLELMEKVDEELSSYAVGEWQGMGRLDDFLRDAARGDPAAIAVIRTLRRGTSRPPPPV
jgi:hypothetical protein